MVRFVSVVVLATMVGVSLAEPPRFKFQKGETLTYHLVHTTRVTEIVIDEKTNKSVETEATTNVDLTRKWKVTEVNAAGVATLEMTIASIRWERKAGKDEDIFDSTKPDDLNKSELAKHVGPVLAIVCVDGNGRVVEVKQSKAAPAERFQAELPFKIVLPAMEPTLGESWNRSFSVKLDPPFGTGEKYAASQKYVCQEPKSGLLTLSVSTEIKELPASASEQIPLLPTLIEGTLYFHAQTGRYYAARLKIQKELKSHQGEGSVYRFASTFVEDIVPEK